MFKTEHASTFHTIWFERCSNVIPCNWFCTSTWIFLRFSVTHTQKYENCALPGYYTASSCVITAHCVITETGAVLSYFMAGGRYHTQAKSKVRIPFTSYPISLETSWALRAWIPFLSFWSWKTFHSRKSLLSFWPCMAWGARGSL